MGKDAVYLSGIAVALNQDKVDSPDAMRPVTTNQSWAP